MSRSNDTVWRRIAGLLLYALLMAPLCLPFPRDIDTKGAEGRVVYAAASEIAELALSGLWPGMSGTNHERP